LLLSDATIEAEMQSAREEWVRWLAAMLLLFAADAVSGWSPCRNSGRAAFWMLAGVSPDGLVAGREHSRQSVPVARLRRTRRWALAVGWW